VDDPTRADPTIMLDMATLNAAKALGLAARIGSLEVAKYADLLMLDSLRARYTPRVEENVVSNLVHFGNSGDVELTMSGVAFWWMGLPMSAGTNDRSSRKPRNRGRWCGPGPGKEWVRRTGRNRYPVSGDRSRTGRPIRRAPRYMRCT